MIYCLEVRQAPKQQTTPCDYVKGALKVHQFLVFYLLTFARHRVVEKLNLNALNGLLLRYIKNAVSSVGVKLHKFA